ncbi:class I SAM-dependent methyltransferase [Lysobacter panacisoli]|uniref:SAM-dependent methyltransferase n=1 Tax=Lysobacter panacisoli TaxID=1255263 RepID=A0ABP9L303_9GAMM|nr:class I SAM-dependent methyltransferase [Lysobacter panacisoli]
MAATTPAAVHATAANVERDAVRPLRLALAIALVSAGALAYQLLLMRWLAIAHWHPFAVMIISLALLGHGASGTWLSLWLRRHGSATLAANFERIFVACALMFAASAILAPIAARVIPFNGLELVWNPRQLMWLSALYLLLSVPFFFAAACFGLAFARHGGRIPMLYGADLAGAGVGALAALAMAWLPVQRGLLLAAACGVLAVLPLATRASARWSGVLALVSVLALWPTQLMAPRTNEFKDLSKTLLLPQARVIAEQSGPYGWLAVVASPRVPLRHAPGLSLSYTDEPPEQLAVYTDGDAPTVIAREDGSAQWRWLEASTSALPYRLRVPDSVLVLGAGGGVEVLQALSLGARRVDAVELSSQRMQWVRDTYARYAGDLFRDRRVRVIVAEPRAFVRASPQRYDLIVLAGGESFASGGAGVQSASEQYALTVEAMREYLSRLTPDGAIVATRWSKQPPRDELKLFATAVRALREDGVLDPARQLAAIRNWDASTWLIARAPLTPHAVTSLQRFSDAQGFDVVQAPGARAAHERFHQLDPPYLFDGVRALLSPESRRYLRDYRFDIAPTTDDRPYFGHFFRWRSLPELLRLRAQGSAVLLDSGYLLLVAALLQAVPLALLLVLMPLRALPRADEAGAIPGTRLRAGLYFLALGLAFLLIEIAMLSRLTWVTGHPLLAANVGLAATLLFAGLGSLQAQRWLTRDGGGDARIARRIVWSTRLIVFGLLWQFVVFTLVYTYASAWPVGLRVLLGLCGLAPLAFAMGMPFPLGLARLARSAPAFVPWAWGLNGCASVIAAILALLLAIAIGLRATLLLALALYLFAAWVWPAQYRSTGSTSSDQRTRRASGAA